MAPALPYIDGETLMSLVPWSDAIAAIGRAVENGAATGGPARTSLPTAAGELLLMPAETASGLGVKLTGIAPGNPAIGLPRIQAVYALFDARTLTPRALLDGTALTTLRTPAQTALAVRALAVPDASSLVVFGAGPQAWGHVHAVRAVLPIRTVTVVSRGRERAAALVDRLRAEGVEAVAGTAGDVAAADVVVCATTAREAVFEGRLLAEHACVAAVGSHEPAARELDDVVFARAGRVVVEERATALREAGDVIQAIASGSLSGDRLTEVADLLDPAARHGAGRLSVPADSGRPRIGVFKGVGMAWQDLAVAEAAYAAHTS